MHNKINQLIRISIKHSKPFEAIEECKLKDTTIIKYLERVK